MIQFLRDMTDNPFLINGLIAGVLASITCGMMGPVVIARRIVFLAGAVAHIAVGGVGASVFLAGVYPETFGWLSPMYGAIIVAVASAVVMGILHERVAERLDTLIGAMWAVGMAAGILLIKFTPGYQVELMTYLFGNIVFIDRADLVLMAALSVVVVATILATYKRLLAVCLDPQQAALQGVSVVWLNVLLLSLVALTVICLVQVVGLILVIALLTLPAATAGHFTRRMASMMFASTVLCVILTTLPRMAVYGSRISPEAAITLTAGVLYLASVVLRRITGRTATIPAA